MEQPVKAVVMARDRIAARRIGKDRSAATAIDPTFHRNRNTLRAHAGSALDTPREAQPPTPWAQPVADLDLSRNRTARGRTRSCLPHHLATTVTDRLPCHAIGTLGRQPHDQAADRFGLQDAT